MQDSSDEDDFVASVPTTPPKPATRVARKTVKYTDSDLEFSEDNDNDDDWGSD